MYACVPPSILLILPAQVQLFNAANGGKLISALTSELISAVPTINAVHPGPHVAAIVSGTASGRLYLWT